MKTNTTTIISGIQPSGSLTLGNYLGAMSVFSNLQNELEMILFVADLHALSTKMQNTNELVKNNIDVVKHYLASGILTKNCHFFLQSQIPEHTELSYILACNSTIGELSRMTQFKAKSVTFHKNKTKSISTGLLVYPLLMAADILLYKPNFVPVGEDQTQHLELTRNLAERLNKKYGLALPKPKPFINKYTAKIMDLQTPNKKMSKSSEKKTGTIFLLDPIEISLKKVKIALTDSYNKITTNKNKQPGISNLVNIYTGLKNSLLLKKPAEQNYTPQQIARQFRNKTYGDFKTQLISLLKVFLEKYQKVFYNIDNEKIKDILKEGTEYCRKIAKENLNEIKEKIGLIPKF